MIESKTDELNKEKIIEKIEEKREKIALLELKN